MTTETKKWIQGKKYYKKYFKYIFIFHELCLIFGGDNFCKIFFSNDHKINLSKIQDCIIKKHILVKCHLIYNNITEVKDTFFDIKNIFDRV